MEGGSVSMERVRTAADVKSSDGPRRSAVMADAAPRCGALPRRRRGACGEALKRTGRRSSPPRGPNDTVGRRSPRAMKTTVGVIRMLGAFMLMTVLLQFWIPATVAADVVPQSSREKEVGDQVIPSEMAETTKEDRLQLVKAPLAGGPSHLQSLSASSTTKKKASTGKKTRKGPKPRVRLIKVYKKVWRDRKPTRKQTAANPSRNSKSKDKKQSDVVLRSTHDDENVTVKFKEPDFTQYTTLDERRNQSGSPETELPHSDTQAKSHYPKQEESNYDNYSRTLNDEVFPGGVKIEREENGPAWIESTSFLNDNHTERTLTSTTFEPNTETNQRPLSNRRKSSRVRYSKVDSSYSTTIPTTLLVDGNTETTIESNKKYTTPVTLHDKIVDQSDYVTSRAFYSEIPESPRPPVESTSRKFIQNVDPKSHDVTYSPSLSTDYKQIDENNFQRNGSELQPELSIIESTKKYVSLPDKTVSTVSPSIEDIHEAFESHQKQKYDIPLSTSKSYNMVTKNGSQKESFTTPLQKFKQEEMKSDPQTTPMSLEIANHSRDVKHGLDTSYIKTEDSSRTAKSYLKTTQGTILPNQNVLVPFDLCQLSLYEFYIYALTSPYLLMLPFYIHCGFTLNQNYVQSYSPSEYEFKNIAKNYFSPLPSIPLTINGLLVPQYVKPRKLKPRIHTHHLIDFIYPKSPFKKLDETLPQQIIGPVDSSSIPFFNSNNQLTSLYVDSNDDTKIIKGSIPPENYQESGLYQGYDGISDNPLAQQVPNWYQKSPNTQLSTQTPQYEQLLFSYPTLPLNGNIYSTLMNSPAAHQKSPFSNTYSQTSQQPNGPKFQYHDHVNFLSSSISLENPSFNNYPNEDDPSFNMNPSEYQPDPSQYESMMGPQSLRSRENLSRPPTISNEEPNYPNEEYLFNSNPPAHQYDSFSRLKSLHSGPENTFISSLSGVRNEKPAFNHPTDIDDPRTQTDPIEYKPSSFWWKNVGPSAFREATLCRNPHFPRNPNPSRDPYDPLGPSLPKIPSFPNSVQPGAPEARSNNNEEYIPCELIKPGEPFDPLVGVSAEEYQKLFKRTRANIENHEYPSWWPTSPDPGMSDDPTSSDNTREQQWDSDLHTDPLEPTTESPCMLGLRMLRDRGLGSQHVGENGNRRMRRGSRVRRNT